MGRNSILVLWAVAVGAVCCPAAMADDAVVIAENGVAKAALLLAADATDAEKHAATELAEFLKEVTGGEFVVSDKANAGQSRLLVGAGAAKLADPGFTTDSLGEEGLVVRTVGNDLILAGGRPRGTLYAVYTFLEDEVGCRWWTSKVSTIPKKPTLKVGPLNVRFVPRLEYRESFWFDALDGDWAVRNQCNGNSDRLDAQRGGKHTYEGFVHTFYGLIPPQKYFQEHPDWFSEIGGQRKGENAQLCLTNEEMRRELVKNLRERLRTNPAATIASVSQNDCFGNCQCGRCTAIDTEEGSPAGSLLRFVNAVATDIEPEFPNVALDTLAYQYTRKPPVHVRPRPNVIVRLCSIECSFSKPLADERNKAFRDDLLGWSKICDRLYVWDYTTNFANYVLPHPNLRVLGPNIRFFVDHGVQGVFEQGAYQSYGSEMAELRGWVLAKLLWDPSRDPQKLIDEFLDGYYGPAARSVREYLKLTHDAVEASGDPLGCFSPADAKFLSLKTLSEGLRLLKAAEAAASGDAAIRHRVHVAQLPVLYAFMVRWEPLREEATAAGVAWPVDDSIRAVYEQFMAIARAEQVTMVAEGRPLDWLKSVIEKTATPPAVRADVRAWEGTITIPTYTWEDDVNPKFWALEGVGKGSAPPSSAIIYPYTMQDNLSRTKVDRTYKALFVENEYLKLTCLPELGGRLHSVLDKTTGQDMFHINHVIKPSMIGMRGAWISGGVEWNVGPQGHTVTCVSPVDALVGQNADGSAYLEVSNLEKSRRTRWTVRVTLHPGRAYLDERIRLFNPTDVLCPYYFWNCTAFPNRPGTRFIFPMSLGTDHSGDTFFTWPIHEGRDLSWLKNYETWSSIFARECTFDFFGAYDVDADRGVVQAADHHQLSGKKAWTWGQWDFGLVSQKNLTDDDGPYIEVQSGPLPTQSDYGALWPRDEVAWQEWWYPVHGLGDGFEFATKDVAIQTIRHDDCVELRLLATAEFPGARCAATYGQEEVRQRIDLSPARPQVITLAYPGDAAIDIAVTAASGDLLAAFTSPLPVPKVVSPTPAEIAEKPDAQLSVEETYLRGRKFDLATNRAKAREYYEKALAQDAGCVRALCGLAGLAIEAGDYASAVPQLERALGRDPGNGLCWYFLGVSQLKLGSEGAALRCASQAARCFGTVALGHDLAGRAYLRLHEPDRAAQAFADALESNPRDTQAQEHLLVARYVCGDAQVWEQARQRSAQAPTALLPRALLALKSGDALGRFVGDVRAFVGEVDFELLETCLGLADVGLCAEAVRVLDAVCVRALPQGQRGALPLYHLAYWTAQLGDEGGAQDYLRQARAVYKDYEFASDPDSVGVLEYAVTQQPDDAYAQYHLGNLYAHLGRLAEAAPHWQKAAALKPSLSSAFRSLGLYARVIEKDLPKAAALYRKAIVARPADQTLFRDLAEILSEAGQRPEGIALLESIPSDKPRRADVTILLAQAYLDEKRFDDVIRLFEATGYFVAWEGQVTTWVIFSRAHVERGRTRLDSGDYAGALLDFDAALTYPENLGVGRSNKPEEAQALYWRGKALAALGRSDEARESWKQGAAGSEGSAEQNEHRQLCRAELEKRG